MVSFLTILSFRTMWGGIVRGQVRNLLVSKAEPKKGLLKEQLLAWGISRRFASLEMTERTNTVISNDVGQHCEGASEKSPKRQRPAPEKSR